jgi:lipoate-protein ligase A
MNAGTEWLRWNCDAQSAALNMATDEVLLDMAADLGKPLLRFYSWSELAATFGYFQKYAEVAALTPLRPLIRRPTGGGLVPHDADWTYSLVFPPSHDWYELKAVQSYERIHSWVQSAFQQMKVKAELAPVAKAEGSGQCFLGAEQHDVLWNGSKIAGGAQRRNRKGLLFQGSIQPPPKANRQIWEKAFGELAEQNWNVTWAPFEPEESFRARAQSLCDGKFSRPEYNQKR